MKSKFKLFITRIIKIAAIILYRIICLLFPVNSRRIVFMSARHAELKDNLYYLYKEMKKDKPDQEYIVLTRGSDEGRTKWWRTISRICSDYYYLATARLFVLDDYYLPLYFIKVRKGTEVIQLWHASGPLKRVGISLRGLPDGPNENYLKVVPVHSNYDKVIVNSDEEIDFYAEAFGMQAQKVIALGSPRTDILFQNLNSETEKEKFLTGNPQFKDKELILYAPTFRGRSNDSTAYVPPIDLDEMIPLLLTKNKVLIFNLHPFMNENEQLINKTDKNAVFWNQNRYTIEELLMFSDVLITDYSSVIYDFAILEKPIALYCYDYDQYNSQRGFYVDVRQLLPDTYFEKEDELLNWILSDSKNNVEVMRLKNKNFKYQDGQSSKRIINSLSL